MAAQSFESASTSGTPVLAEVAQLVGALSHDLAANLMVLESSLKRLKKSHGGIPLSDLADNGDIAKDFAQVDACLRESKRFLDDLRQLSRTGEVQLAPSALKLEPVVRGVVEEQTPVLNERKIRLEITQPLPAVWCNEARLKQVLTNLLRNAVLHGCDAKAPRIAITATPAAVADRTSKQPATSGWIWIRVHDNGRGIPVEHHQSIFLPGKRLANSSSAGTGLGLAIVAQTVAQMGGKVWIDADGPGTSFVFSVPAAPAVVMDQAAAGLPEPHLFRSQTTEPRGGRARRRLGSRANCD